MKNAFYFMLKVFKIYQFLSWLFGHIQKRLDKNIYEALLLIYHICFHYSLTLHMSQEMVAVD